MAELIESPNKPRPAGTTLDVADLLAAVARNYDIAGSGPGSRFEGRLLEDVQAERVMRFLHGSPSPIRLCSVCNGQCVGQWLT